MARACIASHRIAVKTADLAGRMEAGLREELMIWRRRVVPSPGTPQQVGEFGANLEKNPIVVTASGRGRDVGNAQDARRVWDASIMQPQIGAADVALRTDTANDLMAAIGISPALFDARADGTARRESYRQLLHTCIQPWVLRFEAEAREKLMAPGLHINLDSLFAADLAGRARSFGALVKGGMALERAAALSGLMLPDDDS